MEDGTTIYCSIYATLSVLYLKECIFDVTVFNGRHLSQSLFIYIVYTQRIYNMYNIINLLFFFII